MKKTLLLAVLGASVATMSAENKIFFPEAPTGETLGYVTGISANGRYATIFDDENDLSYLWDYTNPLELVELPGRCQAFDVTNDGMVVGATYNSGKYTPAIYRNGEWTNISTHPTSLNINFVRRTTPDGKILGGVQCIKDENIENAMGFRACKWELNDEGQYVLTTYETLPADVAHHQGFWMLGMNEDGSILTGYIMCGKTQCTIPAFVKDGIYQYFVRIEERVEPWYYKDEIMGYDTEYYLDGFHDTESLNNFTGAFNNIVDGVMYGNRTQVENLNEAGEGTLLKGACSYNLTNNEWIDDYNFGAFTVGIGNYVFTDTGKVIENGEVKTLSEAFDIKYSQTITCMQEINGDGKVIGGMYQVMNPATGEYQYFPAIIALDYDLEAVNTISAANLCVNVENGMIKVSGADNVAVYTLDGALISTAVETNVAAGLYIVKADNVVRKVIVK